jgi:hypothetical protein
MAVNVMATTELMVLKQPTLLLSNKSSNVSTAQLSLYFPYETKRAAYSFQSPLHFLSSYKATVCTSHIFKDLSPQTFRIVQYLCCQAAD